MNRFDKPHYNTSKVDSTARTSCRSSWTRKNSRNCNTS